MLQSFFEVVTMIRTIQGAIDAIKKEDPDTPINYYMIRRWILAGDLPAVKTGSKYLVNLEVLESFLKGQTIKP
jgi:excisionase family DNA binding protein